MNTGSFGWVAGAARQTAFLGTWNPEPGQDQPSPLGGDGTQGSPATGWPRYNRVAAQPAPYVGPGQVAWFQFTIQAPLRPGTYRLALRPLIEGETWLEDYGVFWYVTVIAGDGSSGFSVTAGFDAIVKTGPGDPPDPILAVSPSRILAATNREVVLFDKDARRIAVTFITYLFDSVRDGQGLGDPWVLYDEWSQRFFAGAIGRPAAGASCPSGNCASSTFVAVSKSASPSSFSTADWYFYATPSDVDRMSTGERRIPGKADRPRAGVSESVLVVNVAAVTWDETAAYERLRIFDKPALIGGVAKWTDLVDIRQPSGAPALAIAPAQHFDPSPVFFLVTDSCDLTVWGITGDPARIEARTVPNSRVPGTACDSPRPSAPQRGSTSKIDAGDSHVITVRSPIPYRNGRLWVVHTVLRDLGAGPVTSLRFAEIDVSGWPTSVTLRQSILLGGQRDWLYYPALAVDAQQNVAIVFNQSSSDEFVSIYVTGRLRDDPPGLLRTPTLLKAGIAALEYLQETTPLGNSALRYGDYSGAAVDPIDGSFWVISEYPQARDRWSNWIANFTLSR